MHSIRIQALPALVALMAMAALAGCSKEAPKEKFETEPVGRRDIVVSVEASGAVEPLLTVEIKSKASGEVLKAEGQTGQIVHGRHAARADRQAYAPQHAGPGRIRTGGGHRAALHRQGAK